MGIDASIPLQVRQPQLESPVNGLMKLLQLQGAQEQLTASRAAREDDNALRRLLADGADPPAVRKGGFWKQAGEMEKNAAGVAKDQREAETKKFELAKNRYQVFQTRMGALKDDPNLSKEMLVREGQDLVQQGILPAEMYQQAVQNMPDDVPQLRARLTQGLATQMSPDKIFEVFAPKPTQIDNGQQIGYRDTNPNSPTYGQATGGAPVQKQATPGDVMTDNRVRSEGSANRGVTIAGQDKADARARDANRIASDGAVVKTETDLRKEFADLPEVKRYKSAYPSYDAITKAAQINNPQADINLVYGLAKLYDPDSVVREGEYATIANSQAIPEWLKGAAQRLVGGGRLTTETKRQVMEQAGIRIRGYEGEYQKAVGAYEGIAKGRGANTGNVIPSVGRVVDFGSLK